MIRKITYGGILFGTLFQLTAEPAVTNAFKWKFTEHPRLRYVIADAAGKDEQGSIEVKSIIAAAEKILASRMEIPSEEGQWIFYYACPDHNATLHKKGNDHVCPVCGKVYNDERTRKAYVTMQYEQIDSDTLRLALAWHFSKNEAFAREVIRILEHYARIYPTFERHDRWGRRGLLAVIGGKRFCQSLDESVNVIKLAKAYDLVYDAPFLSDEQRKNIEKNLFNTVVDTIYSHYFIADGKNNHMSWYNAAAAVVGVVLGREDILEKSVNGPKGLLRQFKISVTAEGLWYEGTIAYHFYALQAIVETVRAVRECGLDLTTNPVFKKMFTAPLQLAYPTGQLPALNDGDRADIRGYRDFYRFALETWDDPVIKNFALNGRLDVLDSALYQEAGLAYLRRGKDNEAVTVILDFGQHGGHHGHPDKLNMILYALGQEIFFDPGRLTYSCPEYQTWARQTIAHNTVVIGQESQSASDGRCIYFTNTLDFAVVVGEANTVYQGVKQRRFLALFDRFLVDIFSVESMTKTLMDWIIHGQAELSISLNMQRKREEIYNKNGYQYLKELSIGVTNAPFYCDWKLSSGRHLRTNFYPLRDVTVITGKGIGYELDSKVPFLMVRLTDVKNDFIAIHDFSGDGSIVVEQPRKVEGGVILLSVKDRDNCWNIRWLPFAEKDNVNIKK